MYPKQLIQEQVDRFFDKLEKVSADLKEKTGIYAKFENLKENHQHQLMQYFQLTAKILPKFEDAIDELKTALDSMDIEEQALKV